MRTYEKETFQTGGWDFPKNVYAWDWSSYPGGALTSWQSVTWYWSLVLGWDLRGFFHEPAGQMDARCHIVRIFTFLVPRTTYTPHLTVTACSVSQYSVFISLVTFSHMFSSVFFLHDLTTSKRGGNTTFKQNLLIDTCTSDQKESPWPIAHLLVLEMTTDGTATYKIQS